MQSYQYNSIHDGYCELVNILIASGRERPSRAGDTLEIEDMVLSFDNGGIMPPFREGSPRLLGLAEGVQLVGSTGRAGLMDELFPSMSTFTDFTAMYGDRVANGNQVEEVLEKLRANPESRQAVLSLWDPAVDNAEGRRDCPCTLNIQFRIRDDKLNMLVTMRSNDIVRGLYHDATQFSLLHVTLAAALGVKVGTYTHVAGSFHIYVKDIEMASDHVKSVYDGWTAADGAEEILPLAEEGWSYGEIAREADGILIPTGELQDTLLTDAGKYIHDLIAKRRKYVLERATR